MLPVLWWMGFFCLPPTPPLSVCRGCWWGSPSLHIVAVLQQLLWLLSVHWDIWILVTIFSAALCKVWFRKKDGGRIRVGWGCTSLWGRPGLPVSDPWDEPGIANPERWVNDTARCRDHWNLHFSFLLDHRKLHGVKAFRLSSCNYP